MNYIPKSVAFAAAKLEGFSRNRFRLETSGATSATAGSVVTINLPENAIIDIKSLRIHMDVSTTKNGTISSKLPADVSSLISQFELYVGGVQLSQGCSEWNTVNRILKIVKSSRDRDGSVDSLLSHGTISSGDTADSVSVCLCPQTGFFESATRFLPTQLTGALTIRMTFAPNSVLAFKEDGQAFGTDLDTTAKRDNAALGSYTASNIYCTCDSIQLGDTYEQMLLDRLSQEESLPICFKEYYTFSQHGIASTAHTTRFSLSASSIDALYAVFRSGNYQDNGINTRLYSGVTFSDANCSNALHFQSFNSSTTQRGSLKYHWNVNNVRYPQYSADVLEAAADLSYLTDTLDRSDKGHMVTSLQDFNSGKCVLPLVLNMPGQALNVQSGYDSRGSNSTFSLEVSGQVMPTADPDEQTVANISTFVVAETTAKMLISGSRQISVEY